MLLHAKTRSLVFATNIDLSKTPIPHRRVVVSGTPHMTTPCRRDVCAQLNDLGLWPFGPINLDYTWPGKYTPLAHQVRTADYLSWHRRAFCFNDIGTGKTLSTLWAVDYLRGCGDIGETLIVSTLSTLKTVWEASATEHLGLECVLLHGSRMTRQARLASPAPIKIINHEGITVIAQELYDRIAAGRINLIIVDEGAEFANARTNKYLALKWLCTAHANLRVWWLTGSPMPHAPTDIWSQARVICAGRVPKFYSHWRSLVMVQETAHRWDPRPGWVDTVRDAVHPVIRYRRDQCIDLPPTTYSTRSVAMSPTQATAYRDMLGKLRAEIGTLQITAVNEVVKLGKLVQIACGSAYTVEGAIAELDCTPKLEELVSIIRDAGDTAIVFVSFRSSLQRIHAVLAAAKLRVSVVDGSVSASARSRLFDGFQKGYTNVLLAHPRTMAHGLTLTKSSTIIWYGPPQSFRLYEQANGRIVRQGQTQKTTVIKLICSELEGKIYSRFEAKADMQGLLLDTLQLGA